MNPRTRTGLQGQAKGKLLLSQLGQASADAGWGLQSGCSFPATRRNYHRRLSAVPYALCPFLDKGNEWRVKKKKQIADVQVLSQVKFSGGRSATKYHSLREEGEVRHGAKPYHVPLLGAAVIIFK